MTANFSRPPETYPGRYVCDHPGDRREDAHIGGICREDRDAGRAGEKQHCLRDRRVHRPGERSAETVGLCTQLLEDDIPASADAGGAVGAGVPGVPDCEWGAIS